MRHDDVLESTRQATQEKNERSMLIRKIVMSWGPFVKAIYGEDIGLWADRLVPTFRQADTAKLQAASRAVTFEGMVNALIGQKAMRRDLTPGGITPKYFGDPGGDLVFTPLKACNIVDTRNEGGAFIANIHRHFKVFSPSFASQGGSDSNCGVPTNPSAMLLGVTAVDATNRGYFKMWPYGQPTPVSSAMSYGPTQNSRNNIVLQVAQGLTEDFSIAASTSGTHVLISVLGYYAPPQQTPFECYTALDPSPTTLAANSNSFYNSTSRCAETYAPISAFCWSQGKNGVYNAGSGQWTEPTFCQWINTNPTVETVQQGTRCCRVPGR
jgi:hypothetical protein